MTFLACFDAVAVLSQTPHSHLVMGLTKKKVISTKKVRLGARLGSGSYSYYLSYLFITYILEKIKKIYKRIKTPRKGGNFGNKVRGTA